MSGRHSTTGAGAPATASTAAVTGRTIRVEVADIPGRGLVSPPVAPPRP